MARSAPVKRPRLHFRQLWIGADGELSYARVMCAIVVFSALAWVSYIVAVKQQIPDLLGTSALVTALYGFNRVSEAIENK